MARGVWDEKPELLDVGASRIAWRRAGRGEPLVLIHGWPLSSESFRKVLPALAERFTCYLPDTPGLGETEWSDRTDFRFAGQAESLRRFTAALGLERYAILAFDTGATIARQIALTDASRVRRLVLLNTEMPGHRPPFIPLFQKTSGLPGSRAAMRTLLGSRALRRTRLGFGGTFVDLDLLDGEFARAFVAPLLADPRRLEGAIRYLRGIDWELVDGLAIRHREIAAPILLVWGEDDPTFPIARARAMAAGMPSCRGLVAVPGARLFVHEERPDAVTSAAIPFLLER
jgi:haloalkane dehalogenase